MANIIVISAHPDDEVIGVGGTMLKHARNGDKIYWLIITGLYEEYGFSRERIDSRNEEIEKVAARLHVEKTFKLDYPTMQLHSATIIDMVPKVSAVFKEVNPEYIYVLNRSDAHSDHRIVFDAIMACTKSFRYPGIKRVLMYECISETEFAPALPERVFMPNYYVDISPFIDEKLEIMEIYESELGEHPFPRSLENIRAIAHFRGASVGVKYAEAFQLIKFIDKD
ncbi:MULTISPECIES: PIG-L deacetylase family protein [unclassified Chitinophaga]|uniref:PIG-L deacetylase family protein n=1 Tax=unclassified Chitinophaga TaxID=2619133 RepID=UPI00300F7EDB